MRIGNTTWAEFLKRYRPKLGAAPVIASGWPHQCRCGEMTIVRYRGRTYCRACGRPFRRCPRKVTGTGECSCPLPGVEPAREGFTVEGQ